MALATWIIAFAAVVNVFVYWRISQQTREQISLTRDQIGLTRNLFLESNKPELSVSIENCEYSGADELFEGLITLTNHGAATARQVKFLIQISPLGNSGIKDIGPVTIQPKNKMKHRFSFSMPSDTYRIGQTLGNRLGALVEGSYRGLANKEFQYNERQEYDPKLGCFMPFWSE